MFDWVPPRIENSPNTAKHNSNEEQCKECTTSGRCTRMRPPLAPRTPLLTLSPKIYAINPKGIQRSWQAAGSASNAPRRYLASVPKISANAKKSSLLRHLQAPHTQNSPMSSSLGQLLNSSFPRADSNWSAHWPFQTVFPIVWCGNCSIFIESAWRSSGVERHYRSFTLYPDW